MGLLNSLIKKNDELKNTNWSKNLLSSEALKHYFFAKEAIQAYCTDVGITVKRGFALDVERILLDFISRSYSPDEVEFINGLLKKNKKTLKAIKKADTGLYNRLKEINKSGVKLLDLDENVNVESLKKKYRQASMKFHPDVGGSDEKMKEVNEAFTQFHDAIVNYFPLNREGGQVTFVENKPESLDEVVFTAHLILACIQGDFFAADKSYESLKKSFAFSKECRSEYVGKFMANLISYSGELDRCCRALGRMQMKDELKEAASFTSHYIDLYIKHWSPQDEYDYKPSRSDYPSIRDYQSELNVKIVINHPEQAKNAYRLGKIDEKRFEKTMKKYAEREAEFEKSQDAIHEFYSKNSVDIEINDSNYTFENLNPQLVGPLTYFQDRYEFLDDNQKWEYINTFSGKHIKDKIAKYIEIRLNEILVAIIKNYNNLNVEKIKEELVFLKSNVKSLKSVATSMLELLEHLSELNDVDRKRKLNLLDEIDDTDPRSFSTVIVINLFDTGSNKNHQKRVEVTDDYIEFCQMDIKEIEKFKRTGDYSSDFNEAWDKDMKALDKFHDSKVSKQREKYWLDVKGPTPEEVINSSEPYIEGLLELGKTFHKKNTGELQVGYDINRLTTAYAKIKNWEKVKYWCDLFFTLPSNYHDRSSDGEQEKLRKRLERAEKALSKK